MERDQATPRLSIVGLGDYYRKLEKSLWRLFVPGQLLDPQAADTLELPPHLQDAYVRLDADVPLLRQVDSDCDVFLILSPHAAHFAQLQELTRLGKPVIVEKPAATTKEELAKIEAIVRSHRSICFPSFYADVRIAPLLTLCRPILPGRAGGLNAGTGVPGTASTFADGIRRVEAAILEEDPLEAKAWRADPASGGVVLDLMVHLLSALWELFPDDELEFTIAQWRGTDVDREVEVRGEMRAAGAEVHLHVGKGQEVGRKSLAALGETWTCTQDLEGNHLATLESNGHTRSSQLRSGHYDQTAEFYRRWYDRGGATHGWQRAEWSIRTALRIRERGARYHQRSSPGPSHQNPPGVIPRREAIRALAIGVAASWLAPGPPWRRVGTFLRGAWEDLMVRSGGLGDSRADWLQTLLFPSVLSPSNGAGGRALVLPGDSYFGADEAQVDPHCIAAQAVLCGLLPGEDTCMESSPSIPVLGRETDDLLCTGSPMASAEARAYLPYWVASRTAARIDRDGEAARLGGLSANDVPYHFVLGSDPPSVRVISARHHGKEELKHWKGLYVQRSGGRRELLRDWDLANSGGWLETDFLLVSRLPRGGPLEGDVLSIAGGHGAGTSALRLLLDPTAFHPNEARKLSHLVGARYFQFVLEVRGIHRGRLKRCVKREATYLSAEH